MPADRSVITHDRLDTIPELPAMVGNAVATMVWSERRQEHRQHQAHQDGADLAG